MKIEVDINRQDYYDFNKHYFIKTRLFKSIFWAIITLLALGSILNRERFNLTSTITTTIAGAIAYVLTIKYQLEKTKKIPQDSGSILGKKVFEFNDDEIIGTDIDSSTKIKWSALKKIENTKNAFYLYIDTNAAYVIPKRYFTSEIEQSQFIALVNSKITQPNSG